MGGSYETLKKLAPGMFNNPDSWNYVNDNNECFVLAQKGHQPAALQSQLNSFIKKHYKDDPAYQMATGFSAIGGYASR